MQRWPSVCRGQCGGDPLSAGGNAEVAFCLQGAGGPLSVCRISVEVALCLQAWVLGLQSRSVVEPTLNPGPS